MALYSRNSTNTLTTYKIKHRSSRAATFILFFTLIYFISFSHEARKKLANSVDLSHACIQSEASTEECRFRHRRRRRRAALLAEVSEDVIAAVGDDGAVAAAGTNSGTDLDAVLALRVASVHRDVIALAVRRQLPVAKTAVVAARPRRAWFACARYGVAVHV